MFVSWPLIAGGGSSGRWHGGMSGDGPSVAVAGVAGSSWRAGVVGSAVRGERVRLGAIDTIKGRAGHELSALPPLRTDARKRWITGNVSSFMLKFGARERSKTASKLYEAVWQGDQVIR